MHQNRVFDFFLITTVMDENQTFDFFWMITVINFGTRYDTLRGTLPFLVPAPL